MEISRLSADELEAFVDSLWLPAQREMATVSTFTLRDDIRDDGIRHRQSRLSDAEAVTYIARDETSRLGYASASIRTPPPIFRAERECHIDELFVVEDARRRGIGTALLETVQEWGRADDCAWFDLTVDSENDAARGLYESNGYDVERHTLKQPVSEDR